MSDVKLNEKTITGDIKQLLKFYGATSVIELVAYQEEHIARLQERVRNLAPKQEFHQGRVRVA